MIIIDIETRDLSLENNEIKIFSYYDTDTGVLNSLTSLEDIKEILLSNDTIIGHNIILFDIPVLENILNINLENKKLIDTLSLSWYLYNEEKKHSLEEWGKKLGIDKFIINNWDNLSDDTYKIRCESDVLITKNLYEHLINYLSLIYDGNISGILSYLQFLLICIKKQVKQKIKIDKELAIKSLAELEKMKEEKVLILKSAMPKKITYKEVKPPKKKHTVKGELSVEYTNWLKLLKLNGLDESYNDTLLVESKVEEANPNSVIQLKNWLFSLGWKPLIFKETETATGINKVPQIVEKDDICISVKKLIEIEPAVEQLESLSIINHRIGVFKSFIDSLDENNMTVASIQGLTNTLRFKHSKPVVNLPNVKKFYGKNIRGLIIADEPYILCGSDMSALEDTTKQHYMYFFDPEYVKQMRVPGFDPHIDIGVLTGLISPDEAEFYKWYKNKNK